MYIKQIPSGTAFKQRIVTEGERIEDKLDRVVNSNEPIEDGAPLIYTERKNGVEPQYDIRTDRFEIAIDAMDKVSRSYTARREERILKKVDDNSGDPSQHEPSSNTGTDN